MRSFVMTKKSNEYFADFCFGIKFTLLDENNVRVDQNLSGPGMPIPENKLLH